MSSFSRGFAVLASLLLAALCAVALAACGSSSSDSDETSAATSAATSAETPAETTAGGEDDVLAAARAETEEAYRGRWTEPPSDPNPAARDKVLWAISPGQASLNAAVATKAAVAAGERLGWKTHIYDAKLDPANFPKGIQQAVAAGADGIVLMAIDCPQTKSALQEAKEAGVKVVGLLAFDCDEVDPGEEPLFSAQPGLGDRYASWPDAYRAWGADIAAWTIDRTEGRANVLNYQNSEYQILKFLQEGFDERMGDCPDCKLNNTEWTLSEIGPRLAAKVQADFLRVPDANALQADANPTLGFTTGVVQAGRTEDTNVIGGLGLSVDNDVVREGKGLNAIPAWPLDWWAWASVDTLNSLFNGTEVRDSGLGWQMIDRDNNLPPKGENFSAAVDYQAAYEKSWGVK